MNEIVVENYNPNWPNDFLKLKMFLAASVKKTAEAIEHVGSTSVPGLAAKPIIDIDIVVSNEQNMLAATQILKELGYEHRGNLGVEGREAFRLQDEILKATFARHNLYVCYADAASLHNHLTLRDHLRANDKARDEYGKLKFELAQKFPNSIDDYGEGKTDFILSVLATSLRFDAEEQERIREANKKISGKNV